MSSPAHSLSSDDEDSNQLAELKVKHEAELREAAEKKARKDQERRERREREKCEKKEREEREAREEITCRIQEVGRAVADVARGIAETEQEQTEREVAALHRVREDEIPVSLAADIGEGPKVADPKEASEEDGEGEMPQRSPRRQVVRSRHNTAEVVIVRPVAKKKGQEVSGGSNEVSTLCSPRSND